MHIGKMMGAGIALALILTSDCNSRSRNRPRRSRRPVKRQPTPPVLTRPRPRTPRLPPRGPITAIPPRRARRVPLGQLRAGGFRSA